MVNHVKDYIFAKKYKTKNGVTLKRYDDNCTQYWLVSIEDDKYIYRFEPDFDDHGRCIRGTVVNLDVHNKKYFRFDSCYTFHPVTHWVPFMPKSARQNLNSVCKMKAEAQSRKVARLMPKYIRMKDLELKYIG